MSETGNLFPPPWQMVPFTDVSQLRDGVFVTFKLDGHGPYEAILKPSVYPGRDQWVLVNKSKGWKTEPDERPELRLPDFPDWNRGWAFDRRPSMEETLASLRSWGTELISIQTHLLPCGCPAEEEKKGLTQWAKEQLSAKRL